MRDYCCTKFEGLHSVDSTLGLNVRVVKFYDNGQYSFRFWITGGYNTQARNVLRVKIEFCPFCGSDLSAIYSKDHWVNEDAETLRRIFTQ